MDNRMNSLPQVPDYITRLLPQVAGKPISAVKRELGLREVIKLASNENPLGPSERAIEAMEQAVRDAHRYPDAGQYDLRLALAEHHGLAREEVVLGNGSSELIDLLIRTYVDANSHVLTSEGSFIAYKMSTESLGREFRTVPLTAEHGYDLDAMLEAMTPQTRLVFIANPNNPTGTMVGRDELQRFIEKMDAKTGPTPPLLVLDEAYCEYIEPSLAPDSLAILKERPGTVLLRTFSKAYGLAGLRCGYALACSEIVGHLNNVRSPFNVGSIAQIAAIAALADTPYLEATIATNHKNRKALEKSLVARGFSVTPSHANFLLVDLKCDGKRIFERLLQHGVITRPVGVYGLPNCLRITVGTAAENARLLDAVDAIFHVRPQRLVVTDRNLWRQMARMARAQLRKLQPNRIGAQREDQRKVQGIAQ